MKDPVKKLEELFKDISTITPDRIEGVVGEFVKTFEYLMEQMQSSDEEVRKKAFAQADELRNSLETQAEKVLEQSGLNYKDLENFAQNPDNFDEEEWTALQGAREELENYQNHATNDKPRAKKSPRKLRKAAWIQS